jgi:hypothetical protein
MSYEEFLASKRLVVQPSGFEPGDLGCPQLFDFQRDVVRWALRIGKAAIWEDCGLGKSVQALVWASHVAKHTSGQVIILTPLAVARQFVSEGEKFGIPVIQVREQADCGEHPIVVTNYERLHRFQLGSFAGVVADESSIFKGLDNVTRTTMVQECAAVPFRLSLTATPAPNDYEELAGQSEFLGLMTRAEMLATFFSKGKDSTQDRRLMGHARRAFWEWLASWAVNIRRPSDLGYSDDGFVLPPLVMHEHVVDIDVREANAAATEGDQLGLVVEEARGLIEQRRARKATIAKRAELLADMVNSSDEPWLVWCALNAESDALAKAIPDAAEVRGTDKPEDKEERLWGFARGKYRVLVSKPKIAGWGMNFQHCANVAFVGIGNSFEEWYQAVRRSYRFGQRRPVNCHMISSQADGAIAANLKRKQLAAEEMAEEMVRHMADLNRANLQATARTVVDYHPRKAMRLPPWLGQRPNETPPGLRQPMIWRA